jgi:hypothetical protein
MYTINGMTFRAPPCIFYPSNRAYVLAVYNPARQISVFSKSSTDFVQENSKIKELQSVASQG